MDSFSFYQDVKVTVWARQKFEVDAESYEDALTKVEPYKREDASVNNDLDVDVEWLWDTWEPIEPKDNGGAATIELYERCNPENKTWKPTMIGDNATPKVPLSDRKDLYVIRTLFWMGDEQEYGYWMSSKEDSLAIGLYKENNSAHIFEEKDKVLAEHICELLNKSQHEHYYEVVSFYNAWRCY